MNITDRLARIPYRTKVILISGAVLFLLMLVVLFMHSAGPKADSRPSAEVVAVITKYIQARENSVGADQTSPDAWISAVKPVVTPSWLGKITPEANPQTGSTPYDYTVAHQKNW